ncbi:MAG: lactonase family protein [Chloroflexota bacterium]|nr:lactonase family protein [Chloroflexota bacterium]
MFPLVGAAALAAFVGPGLGRAQEATGGDDQHDDGQSAPSRFVYVGTYTAPNTAPGGSQPSTAKGIYVFKMNGRNGRLRLVQVFDIENPSWVTVDANASHLYATSEVSTWKGATNTGGVTAFAIDSATGMITRIDDQPTRGAIPAHVIVDPSGKYALVANYVGANWSVLPIRPDGGLDPATDVFGVTGHGPNLARQEAPHPHQTLFDPAGKYVFGPDLGTDNVWSWTFDAHMGKLVPNPNLDHAQVASGSGPRHLSFHPSGKFVYVVDEMASSITAFTYDAARGTFTWLQTVSTLPANFTATSTTAEIIVHPSGKFVYASNRGHNSIVGFRIDQATGKLSLIGWTSTRGAIPRGFNIDPSGRLMLVGNQNSNSVVPFRINLSSGNLQFTGGVTNTPVPVSFAFGRVIPDGE